MLDFRNKLRKMIGLSFFAALILFLCACLPTTNLTQPPTNTTTPSPTATSTVIWFPPTATSSPIPTVGITPTSQWVPGVGKIILTDDFNNIAPWITGNPENGTVALGINEITLVINQPKGYLYSYRNEPILTDFYAEITATPLICAGMDEYGILFRYNSPVDFYRFSLSCDGRTRLDKLVGGSASSPQPWLDSISVPRVASSSSRIGVWAVGSEMQFFVNNEFQFSVSDRTLSRGLIGLFARSAGENAVTVSFSTLVINLVGP